MQNNSNRNRNPNTNNFTNNDVIFLNNMILSYNENIRQYQNNISNMFDAFINHHIMNQPQNRRMYNTRTLFPTSRTSPLFTSEYRNVNIHPSTSQIQSATEEIIYSDHNLNIINTTCPITLDDFVDGDRICRIKHCGHAFKYSEITRWFSMNVHCPVCRYDIREYVSDLSNNLQNNRHINNTLNRVNNVYANANADDTHTNDANTNDVNADHDENINMDDVSSIVGSLSNIIRNYITNELSSTGNNNNFVFSIDIPTISYIDDPALNDVD